MQHIKKLNNLAKNNSNMLLREYFCDIEQPADKASTFNNFRDYCLEYGSDSITIRRMALRLNMLNIKRDAVKAVINELEPEVQELLYLYYAKNMTDKFIGHKVNISEATVNDIRNSVQIKIHNFIRYRLTAEDIFYRRKIINMIEMLARLIKLTNALDFKNDFTNKHWEQLIKNRYNNYRKVLSILDEKISQHELNMENFIIWQKTNNPSLNNLELTTIHCKPYSTASVSRTINKFKKNVSKYLYLP